MLRQDDEKPPGRGRPRPRHPSGSAATPLQQPLPHPARRSTPACRHRPVRREPRRRRAPAAAGAVTRVPKSATVPGSAKASITARKIACASNTGSARPPSTAMGRNRHQSLSAHEGEEVDASRLGLLGAPGGLDGLRRERGRDEILLDAEPPIRPLPDGIEMRRHPGPICFAAEDHGMADLAGVELHGRAHDARLAEVEGRLRPRRRGRAALRAPPPVHEPARHPGSLWARAA